MINEASMILARDLTSQWVGGWQFSEKLNGCRVEWDGKLFWTRSGHPVDAPRWFTKGLPRCRINGEIHAGRGRGLGNHNSAYKVASNAVRLGGDWFHETDDGEPLRFTALFLPEAAGNWAARQRAVARAVRGRHHADAIRHGRVRDDNRHYAEILLQHVRLGSEGVMFLNPDGGGEQGRTGELLRVKFN